MILFFGNLDLAAARNVRISEDPVRKAPARTYLCVYVISHSG